jgi:hypothetical protein
VRSSTLLVLLGISIIGVSIATFASFILNNGGPSGPWAAPAGSILSVAILLGLGQIIIGRALQPEGSVTEKLEKKEKQKMAQQSLSKSRSRTEEEAPRIIAVDDQEPSAWLKTTLEKLAEQGSEKEEEGVVPAELTREPVSTSKPRSEERTRPAPFPQSAQPKVRGTLVNNPPEYTRMTPRKEPITEQKVMEEESKPEPEAIPLSRPETPPTPATPMEEEEESRPGVRRLREMEITFVERDGITFLEPGTGIHERYPCEDQTLIDYAWRALVRGLKVNAGIDSGKVSKLTPA